MKPTSDKAERGEAHDGYDGRGDREAHERQPGDWLLKLGMISGVVLALVAVCALVYFSVIRKLDFDQAELGSAELEMPVKPANPRPDETSGLGEAQSLDLVRRALAIRLSSEAMNAFRMPSDVDAPTVVDYLETLPEHDGLVVGMEYLEPVERDGVLIERVRIHCRDGSSRHYRDAHLLMDEDGEWKVDYEAFVNRAVPVIRDQEEEER
ncbi:MAG: hypothetical protein R3242_05645 [Akkermansiaceae bacterium]|nr:hypothetical protein [Akkermansiaceae bacterium]